MRTVQPRHSFIRTLLALLASFLMTVGTLWWAKLGTGMALEPLDATCARQPNFNGDEGTKIIGEWSWFPPGLRCSADYGGSAGWREFVSPSWWESLLPLALLGIALVWLLIAATATIRRTARQSGYGRAITQAPLLLLAIALVILSPPVALELTGALAVIWVPVALIVAAPLLVTVGLLARTRKPTVERPSLDPAVLLASSAAI